jgi:hypothetical protein
VANSLTFFGKGRVGFIAWLGLRLSHALKNLRVDLPYPASSHLILRFGTSLAWNVSQRRHEELRVKVSATHAREVKPLSPSTLFRVIIFGTGLCGRAAVITAFRPVEYRCVATQSLISAITLLAKAEISLFIADNLVNEILCAPLLAAFTDDVSHEKDLTRKR